MNFFLDFCNLLEDNWELISTRPMLFVIYTILVIALTLVCRRIFAKSKLDLDLLREKNTWEEACFREREKNRELKCKNSELTVKIQKMQSENTEQGNRLHELTVVRIRLLRKIDELEEKIKNLETKEQRTEREGNRLDEALKRLRQSIEERNP